MKTLPGILPVLMIAIVRLYLLIMTILISSSDISYGLPERDCTTNVTVNVNLSCNQVKPGNAYIMLSRHNPGTPPPQYDSVYILVSDSTGILHFNNLCNGIYDLTANDFGYDLYQQSNISITGDTVISLTISQIMAPPPATPGLLLNNQTLLARWSKPHFSVPLLAESWDSGNFVTNLWIRSGSANVNWVVDTFGFPLTSAEFNGYPWQSNYDGYLTSKPFTGLHSPGLTLSYDIYLNNYDVANVNTLAVELWNGTTWTVLKTYTNQGGNIVWTHQHLDMSSVTNTAFQVRFHAAGTNSVSIKNWNLDNIMITANSSGENEPCLSGYKFYLDNTLIAWPQDTFYTISPGKVVYGNNFTACVVAVYDSGISGKTCVTFASRFLCPVTNVNVVAVTNAAYLTWTKPQCLPGQNMCFTYDDGTMENGVSSDPGTIMWYGNKFIIDPTYSGVIKSFDLLWWNNPSATNQNFRIEVFNMAGVLLGSSQAFQVPIPAPSTFMTVTLTNEIPFSGRFYGMVKWNHFVGVTHWLGEDENGPYVNSGVGYYYNGQIFRDMAELGQGEVFTERCCAFINNENKLVMLGSGSTEVLPQSHSDIQSVSFPAVTQGVGIDSHDYSIMTGDSQSSGTGLIGYNVYQDNVFHHFVPGEDSLRCYCFNVNPGLHCFDVTAKYDLSAFGFPGTFGESLNENPGPACADWVGCCILPFLEPWNGGSLGYQNWINGSNWVYDPGNGNPAPTAKFKSQPVIMNYNSSLKTPTLDLTAWTCGTIWLDFDYKLEDLDANGTEKMDIEVYWKNTWHLVKELANTGSVNWTKMHLDISVVEGQQFGVRFRSNGVNTLHILSWYFDNIKVYGICANPVDLKETHMHDTVNLTWSPPQCGPAGQLMCFAFDDGKMENSLAISPGIDAWLGNLFSVSVLVSGNIHSFDLLWSHNPVATSQDFHIDVFSPAGVLMGSSQTFRVPIPPPDTFMTVTLARDIPFSGPFYGMIHWNNFNGPTDFLGLDQNGPNASYNLAYYYDGMAFTHMSAVSGNGIPGVFTERMCALTYGADKAPDSSVMIGYNIFRYDSLAGGVVNFHKLNNTFLTTPAYQDTVRLDTNRTGFYRYFVTAMFNNSVTNMWLCESPGSDTIGVLFPLPGGVEETSGGSILIFPNPANDVVSIKSDFSINRIEILNFAGQQVYSETISDRKLIRINTSSLESGIYIIKITTAKGVRTAKIILIR
jgi:hypothetical protein